MPLLGLAGASELLRDYRAFAARRFPAAVGLMVAGAIAEGLGIIALIPLLGLAGEVEDLPGSLRNLVVNAGLAPAERFALALGLFLIAMLARSLLLYRRDRLLARLSADYEASLKLRAARSLAGLGWERAARVGQAGMQSLLLNDIPRSALAVHYFQVAMVASIMLAVQFALAAALSAPMAGVALALVGGGLLLSRVWLTRGERRGYAIIDVSERSSAAAFRLHAGLKAAMAQGTVPQFLREYEVSLGDLSREVVAFDRDRALAQAFASAGAAGGAVLMLLVGELWLDLPLALLLALLVLFARMAGPAQQLQQALQGLSAHVPSFVAVEKHIAAAAEESRAADAEPLEWRELRVAAASYAHPGGKGGIEGAEFAIRAGQWVGLSGRSGAGKTTVADLIAGLLSPHAGAILVDGAPLEGRSLEGWRGTLAYVGQTDTVFDDSVRGNLLADGAEADEARMWEALEAVGLRERIRALPAGLDQHVGDRGNSLSGGERQRLTLARALLRRPSLLILDEATNALDAASEREVLERLRNFEPRPAALVIAHRPAPLKLCDAVVEIGGDKQRSG